MQSRRDHLQAYQFSVGRLVRAITVGDATAGEVPMRRSNLGVVIGTALGVLLAGGATVFGLISPAPSAAWRANGSVIVEKETGTRYIYLGGVLHPTANYASALLVSGSTAAVQYVPRAQLAGVPVGAVIGIAGAPDDLPPTTGLLPGVWAVCLRGDGSPVLDLAPSGHSTPAPSDQRILVASTDPADPAEYIVWNSVKYQVPHQTVLPALGLGDQQPIPVDPAFLTALPSGAAVAAAVVPDSGKAGPAIDGKPSSVGELFDTVSGGVDQHYILLSDGLAPITTTEAALFSSIGAAAPRQVSPAVLTAVAASPNRTLLSRLPDFVSGPVFADRTGADPAALCARQVSPGSPAASRVILEKAATVAADPAVVVPTGSGLLAQLPAVAGAAAAGQNGPVFLVTASGKRFLITGGDALNALGYGSAPSVVVPAAVLALIPGGPPLDVSAARQAATGP